MILEHAVLNVKPGQETAFEAAIRSATPLIEQSQGFQGIEVRSCIEQPGQYLLLVWWDSVEDHETGFRSSDRYQKWRALLHDFYDPFPTVQHYSRSILG